MLGGGEPGKGEGEGGGRDAELAPFPTRIIRFCPLLEKFCLSMSTFQTFCLDGVQVAQMVFILPTFKFKPGKGVSWGGVAGVFCTYISPKGVRDG